MDRLFTNIADIPMTASTPFEDHDVDSAARHATGFGIVYIFALLAYNTLAPVALSGRLGGTDAVRQAVVGVYLMNPLPLIGLLVILSYLYRTRESKSIARIYGRVTGRTMWLFLGGILLSIIVAATGLWPWAWQSPGNTLPNYFLALVKANRVHAIGLFLLTGVVAVPIVEETIFRLGLLQTLRRRFGSDLLAIGFCSVVFGVLHLGNLNTIETNDVSNGIGAALLGAVCGALALSDNGKIRNSIAIHAARNAIESAILIIGVYSVATSQ